MRIALAGNPNSGKTTMYNLLTGSNEHVGNWAGVTVDKEKALLKRTTVLRQLKRLSQLTYQEHIQCLHSHQKKV